LIFTILVYINIVITYSLKTRNEIIENEESDERYILGKGEMIIGIDTNKPPLSYLDDGELTGFEIEFAKAVCSRLSIDVVFKEIKWNMRETELNSKSIDCVWNSFTVTEERCKTIEFSRVYMNNRQVVVIKKSDTSKFPDAKSLSGAKMSAGVDTTGEEALLGDPDLSQSEYIVSSSQNDAIYGLMSGLYDAIVIDYTSAKGYITDDDSELMIIEGISLQEEQYAVGFRHGSDIIKRINDVFLDMILDGSLSTLVKKYNLYELFSPYEISDSNYIMNNGKMIIGIQGNVPPMSYYDENGELTGFDIEFARAACQQLGIDAEFKTIFWDKKESDLKKRNIDCIWNTLTVTDDCRDNIKFTRIYMSNKQVVMIKKSDASIYSDLKSLTKAKISAETKSTGEEAIQNDTYLSQSEYIYSASMEKAIEALKNDEVDAIVIDYTVAQNNIVNENSDLMIIDEINFGEELYAVGFRINSDMTIKINELINNMINDGSLKSLANKFNLGDLYTSALERDETSDMDYIMTKGQMIIGIESNTPPLMYYDEYGQITGFNIEFAKAVCYELNIDVIFKDIDWENKDNELNSKSIDCLWNALTITEERHNYFAFSHAYLNNKQVIVVRKSDASKFTDVKSFVNTKISAEAGTTGEDEILNNSYFSQAKYTASASQDEAILALINGKFDAIVIDYTLAKGTIAKKYPDLTIFEGIGLQEEQYGVGFRFGSDMAKKVDNVILDMITDGTLGNLAKKYDLIELFKPIRITDYDYIIGNGKLVIGYEGTTPPMTYFDDNGQLIGFDVEFARLVCQQFGIEPEFKEIDWNTKEIDLKERKIDCIWNSLTVTDERREDMKFSRIYMSNKLVVLINKSNASKYTDLKSLSGEKLSFESSSTAEKAIRNNRYLSKTEFIEVPSQNDAILALKSGKADAIVIDYTMAVNSISHDSSELIILNEMNTEEEMYAIGFRLGTDMTIKVNEIINKMMNDGTLESLAKKYNLIDLYNSVIKNDNQSDYDYIMAKGEMNIGIEINSPPMNYYDEYGDLIGFDCELAEAVCSKLGINAIFVNIEWDMKETLLNNKTIDCIWSSFTVTEERRNYFSFTQPYLSNRPAVIIKKSDASKFTDVESLSTSTISAENESTGEEAILNDPYLSHSNYIVSYSLAEAINGLKNGDFDAIVTDYTLAKGTIADGNEDLMIVKRNPFPRRTICRWFSPQFRYDAKG